MIKMQYKIIAILIIMTILISNFSGLLSSVVYASNNYTITFEGAHLGNGEEGYNQNDVIYYYFEETFFNDETQQQEVNKEYIRARIEEKTSADEWLITNLFNTNGENQTATFTLEDSENVNSKYRINFEGDITRKFNVYVNNEKLTASDLIVEMPIPNDNYTITILNKEITDGMTIRLEKRELRHINFNSNPTFVDSTTLAYTDGENGVTIQLGTKESDGHGGYTFTPVLLNEINDTYIDEHGIEQPNTHIEAEIEASSLQGYYLFVNIINEVEASAWINGNEIPQEWIEPDESDNTIIWVSLAQITADNTNIDIIVGNQPQGPTVIVAPEIKQGYITASMEVAQHSSGQINYFFVNQQGKYLSKEGKVLTEQKELAGAIKSNDEIKEVLIPQGTVKVLIGLESGANSDFYNIVRYHDEHNFENIEKDNVNHGNTIEIEYNENDSIALAIGIEYINNGFYPDEKGTYLVADFRKNDDVIVKYIDAENHEQILTNATYSQENVISIPKEFTMQITQKQIDNLHIDVYDENLNLLEGSTGDIALLLADEEDETKNFESWITKLIDGESATLDLSSLDSQDFTFVIRLNLIDPHESDYAHVFTWTNMKGSGWEDDALIDGGFVRIVRAYDKDNNLIYNVNEEYDESHYVVDDRGFLTDKYFYGDLMPYEWERGPMYEFAIKQNDDGGEVEAIEGIKLVIELVPVYGKQLVGVSLGESIGTAEAGEARYYTVTMPPRHTHFNAQFEDVSNEKIIGVGSNVSEMTYTLDEEALDSGTALLSIDKIDNLTQTQKEAFASQAGENYTVSTYLDIDLTQVWFKGTNATFNKNTGYLDSEVWTKEIYDLGNKKATITIKLDEGTTPDDVIILHEIHDNVGNVTGYETVKITNKSKDANGIWTITFETSRFSNYAVATKVITYINPFKDVKEGQWYYNAIKYVYENNIIKGYDTGSFGVNDKLTRGQLVTILHRMEKSPKVTGKSKFPDVQDSTQYYYNAVIWATNNKIVSGYENGKFGPNDNITREQLAVILWKYARYKGKDISKTNDLKGFGDTKKISSFALNQVKWAVAVGVITGNNNTTPPTINPLGTATRAEVAAMMEKYCKKVGR